MEGDPVFGPLAPTDTSSFTSAPSPTLGTSYTKDPDVPGRSRYHVKYSLETRGGLNGRLTKA